MREKLIKLLQLSQSSNDHEALIAIRKANKLLRDTNQDWAKFLEPTVVERQVFVQGSVWGTSTIGGVWYS